VSTTELPHLLARLAQEQDGDSDPHAVTAALEEIVLHPDYPCLGARSVFNRERATVVVLDDLATPDSTQRLVEALSRFGADTDRSAGFASLVAVFRSAAPADEAQFEQALWRQLGLLHDADADGWNPDVSPDPSDPHFAFSLAGTAYFVVGLHPAASRIARRTPLPTLVFNLHDQFEELRRSARFERMRDTIRRRDRALQGSVNPMVADHGRSSEARQYSGRRVPDSWTPPVSFDGAAPDVNGRRDGLTEETT
jgi:FPC/CPF motif-containing protein YcgG